VRLHEQAAFWDETMDDHQGHEWAVIAEEEEEESGFSQLESERADKPIMGSTRLLSAAAAAISQQVGMALTPKVGQAEKWAGEMELDGEDDHQGNMATNQNKDEVATAVRPTQSRPNTAARLPGCFSGYEKDTPKPIRRCSTTNDGGLCCRVGTRADTGGHCHR
jgi:hypothetical protein